MYVVYGESVSEDALAKLEKVLKVRKQFTRFDCKMSGQATRLPYYSARRVKCPECGRTVSTFRTQALRHRDPYAMKGWSDGYVAALVPHAYNISVEDRIVALVKDLVNSGE